MRIFGVILAGGQGRRMALDQGGAEQGGTDKALLAFGGATLLEQVTARMEPQVEQLALSANGDAARFARFRLPVLADEVAVGPLAGLLAALRWAQPLGATAVLCAPVDGPFLPGDLCPRLCLAAETSATGLAIARAGGRVHPTYGLWPVGLTEALATFLGSGVKPKVMDFATAQSAAVADFPDPDAFMNLNTPDDLARAMTLMQADP